MKLAAIAAVLVLALVATVSAAPLVAAGPADYGYGSEVPPAAEAPPATPVNSGVINDDADYYTHFYYEGVGAEAQEVVKHRLAAKQFGVIDAFTPTTKANIAAGVSLNKVQDLEFAQLYGEFAKYIP
jgi:hypothetical protein